jgi:hypothetical protein
LFQIERVHFDRKSGIEVDPIQATALRTSAVWKVAAHA